MNMTLDDPDMINVLNSIRSEYQERGIDQALDAVSTISSLTRRSMLSPAQLSEAERHMLSVHDNRCGEFLQRAACTALVLGHEGKEYFYLTEAAEQKIRRWNSREHQLVVQEVLTTTQRASVPSRWQLQGASPEQCTRISVRLAQESLNLFPSWKTRIYLGRGLTALREWRSAATALSPLLRSSAQNPRLLYYSWIGMAVLLGSSGKPKEALSAYREAARQFPGAPGLMNWFALACSFSSLADALEAARSLDDLPAGTTIPIPTKDDRRPRVPVEAFINRIRDRLGNNSGRIADALLMHQ